MELFEVIRRDHFVHGRSVRAIARQRRVHRRTVRQALLSSVPPIRNKSVREPRVLTKVLRTLVDGWLVHDQQAPRKQRHTARRIYQRLVEEHRYPGAESTVRYFVSTRRRELGLKIAAYVPREWLAGEEAEVDWYEARVDFPSGPRVMQFFQMRACFSGREFHLAFERQTQQAFVDGHVQAFAYFGGVFARIRYDNLGSAVKRVLQGRRREETARFIALRSHYLFEAEFCQPGLKGAPEKGGVESGVGRFRRRHLVPVPQMDDIDALNAYLARCCALDDARRVEGRAESVAVHWVQESARLRALPAQAFATAEVSTHRVDAKSRVRVRTNHYSVPVRYVARQVEVRVQAHHIVIFAQGREVARHRRAYTRHGETLVLDHYLELLQRKPGALARSKPLAQARRQGHWPDSYDRLWASLRARHGDSEGTGQLLEVIWWHRHYPSADIHQAIDHALALGCTDAGSIAVLIRQRQTAPAPSVVMDPLGGLAHYGAPARENLSEYDALRTMEGR